MMPLVRWMARRRSGYGFAVIIGVLVSAWAHDFGGWCYEVFPLFGIRAAQPLSLAVLEKIPEPPAVELETLRYRAPPAPGPPKAEGMSLKKKDSLTLKKKNHDVA